LELKVKPTAYNGDAIAEQASEKSNIGPSNIYKILRSKRGAAHKRAIHIF
jgi:hypothetical protein